MNMKLGIDIQPSDWRTFFKPFIDGEVSMNKLAKSNGISVTTMHRFFSKDPEFLQFKKSLNKPLPPVDELISNYKGGSLSDYFSTYCVSPSRVVRTYSKDSEFSKWYKEQVTKLHSLRGKHSRLSSILPTWQEFFKDYSGGPILSYVRSKSTESADNVIFYYKYNFPDFVEWYNANVSGTSQSNYKSALQDCEAANLTLVTPYSESFTTKFPTRLMVRCNVCGKEYETLLHTHVPSKCPVCYRSNTISLIEMKVRKLLEDNNIEFYPNYRRLIYPMELDIYIPSKGVAFELNGQHYHSADIGYFVGSTFTNPKPVDYHSSKTTQCLENGVKLYHLWDYLTDEQQLSIIKSKLNLNHRLYARKMRVVEDLHCREFFTRNHADGACIYNKTFSLVLDNKVYASICLSIRNIQRTSIMQWEIGRFATELGYTVVGGYSRLLKHAIQYLKSIGVTELISYCNRDLSPDYQDTFYYKYGFEFCGDSGPIYWYYADVKSKLGDRVIPAGTKVSRQFVQAFSKEEVRQSGLVRCYNSGNWKFRLRF